MSTTFPTSLQDLDATRGTTGQPLSSPNHITHHQKEDDTIEALQAKVGVDSSAVTSSLDYKIRNIPITSADSSWNGVKMFKGYAADAGSTDSYAISAPGGSPGSYTAGDTYIFKANTANTGAASLNVNSLGAKTIKKNVSSDLDTNDIAVGQLVEVVYDGTNFQMLNFAIRGFAQGSTTKDISSTTTTTIAHGLSGAPRMVNLTFLGSDSSSMFDGVLNFVGSSGSGVTRTVKVSATVALDITSASESDFWLAFAGSFSTNRLAGSMSVDGTNITITWTKTGSPSGTVYINWVAHA